MLTDIENEALSSGVSEEDRKVLNNISDTMRAAMKAGKSLTEPFSLCSHSGKIEPYLDETGEKITYTKPVLIVVDELSISCGDYFPALMQDEGRAVLFGSATMGAGGSVVWVDTRIGYSEIKFSYTITLGWRGPEIAMPGGKATHYLENVGAIPDIEYGITLEDFRNGLADYKYAMVQSALGLTEQ